VLRIARDSRHLVAFIARGGRLHWVCSGGVVRGEDRLSRGAACCRLSVRGASRAIGGIAALAVAVARFLPYVVSCVRLWQASRFSICINKGSHNSLHGALRGQRAANVQEAQWT